MFSSLFNGLSESKKSMEEYREWAGEITASYMNSGAQPTNTLTKIAQLKDLKPHQVEVLAAEANKMIHNEKYASAKEKYFAADFPLADAKIAINNLQLDGGEKIASSFQAPIFEKKDEIDLYKAFGVEPEEIDKTASVKYNLKVASEKATTLAGKIKDEIIVKEAQLKAEQTKFIKMARQYMLEESNSDSRLKILGTFDHFVKCSEMDHGNNLLAKLAYVLGKEGKIEPNKAQQAVKYFSKEADCKAPAEMISDNLPGKVINGSHPLYITLKTVGDHEGELMRHTKNSGLVDDKVRILKQKIRAL